MHEAITTIAAIAAKKNALFIATDLSAVISTYRAYHENLYVQIRVIRGAFIFAHYPCFNLIGVRSLRHIFHFIKGCLH